MEQQKTKKQAVRQEIRPPAITGRKFIVGIAAIVLRLAVCQIFCNLLIRVTGIGLLNILFYLYAVWIIVKMLRRTAEGYTYVLTEDEITFERRIGDSTVSVVTIPVKCILAVRPALAGERLKVSYKQVTCLLPRPVVSFRMKLAFASSLFSTRLARRISDGPMRKTGWILAFSEENTSKCCLFSPDDSMQEALSNLLRDRWNRDDRLSDPHPTGYWARCLKQTFPEIYPHVQPLVSEEDERWAEKTANEIAGQKNTKQNKGQIVR